MNGIGLLLCVDFMDGIMGDIPSRLEYIEYRIYRYRIYGSRGVAYISFNGRDTRAACDGYAYTKPAI